MKIQRNKNVSSVGGLVCVVGLMATSFAGCSAVKEAATDSSLAGSLSTSLQASLVKVGVTADSAKVIATDAATAANAGAATAARVRASGVSIKGGSAALYGVAPASDITIIAPLFAGGAVEALSDAAAGMTTEAEKLAALALISAATVEILEGTMTALTEAQQATVIGDLAEFQTAKLEKTGISVDGYADASKSVTEKVTGAMAKAGVPVAAYTIVQAAIGAGSTNGLGKMGGVTDAQKVAIAAKAFEGFAPGLSNISGITADQLNAGMEAAMKAAIGQLEGAGFTVAQMPNMMTSISAGGAAGTAGLPAAFDAFKPAMLQYSTAGAGAGMALNPGLTGDQLAAFATYPMAGAINGLALVPAAQMSAFVTSVGTGATQSLEAFTTFTAAQKTAFTTNAASGAIGGMGMLATLTSDQMATMSGGFTTGMVGKLPADMAAEQLAAMVAGIGAGTVMGAGAIAGATDAFRASMAQYGIQGGVSGLDKIAGLTAAQIATYTQSATEGGVGAMATAGIAASFMGDFSSAITKGAVLGAGTFTTMTDAQRLAMATAASAGGSAGFANIPGLTAAQITAFGQSVTAGATAGAAGVMPADYLATAAASLANTGMAGMGAYLTPAQIEAAKAGFISAGSTGMTAAGVSAAALAAANLATTNGVNNYVPPTVVNSYNVTAPTAPTAGSIRVDYISPPMGSIAGGTLISINGAGFTGTETLTIAGAACTSMTLVSASKLTCLTPAKSQAVVMGTPSPLVITPTPMAGQGPPAFFFGYMPPM